MVAAVRLLMSGRFIGAALVARHQLERWSQYRAFATNTQHRAGEPSLDYIARVWSTSVEPDENGRRGVAGQLRLVALDTLAPVPCLDMILRKCGVDPTRHPSDYSGSGIDHRSCRASVHADGACPALLSGRCHSGPQTSGNSVFLPITSSSTDPDEL